MNRLFPKYSLFVLLLILVLSCDNSNVDKSKNQAQIKNGRFVVLPVEGLSYETPTLQGKTGKLGIFSYREGEKVRFKIGHLIIGEGVGSDVISPNTLFDNSSYKASINIAMLLLTLDENNNDGVSIKLPDVLDKLELPQLDFTNIESINRVLEESSSLTSKSYILVDPNFAENIMTKYVNAYSLYKPIDTNYFFSNYDEYHLLILEEDSNVFFTHATCPGAYCFALQSYGYPDSYVGLSFYDLDSNAGNDQGSRLKKHAKGTYIVKMRHSSLGIDVGILYPSIIPSSLLFSINQNGRYTGRGVMFYTFDIKNLTTVRFTTDDFRNLILTKPILFDSKLNIIKDMSGGGTYDVTLDKGKYIFVYDHYDSRLEKSFSIYSMAFRN